MAGEIHVGDVGFAFQVTLLDDTTSIVLDVSGASAKVLWFQKPDGTTVEFPAAFVTDGTDGKIQYVTADGTDLDQAGTWKVQGVVTLPGAKIHSDIGKFKVLANLRADT